MRNGWIGRHDGETKESHDKPQCNRPSIYRTSQ